MSIATRRSLFGYVTAGVTGVAVYAGCLEVSLKLGAPPVPAFTASYLIAVTVQFLMNRYWSFSAQSGHLTRQIAAYGAVLFINYVLMLGVEEVGLHVLHWPPMAAFGLSVPVNTSFGYLANRYVTFR